MDGDHITIVKPLDREHLAYKKLRAKALGATLKVSPTAQGKIAIWVARVIGDNDIRGAQGSIVENLRTHIARQPELKSVVEIRELPVPIAGSTDDEENIEAERIGKQYNAAILVWGKVTGQFKEEFHPRVMLITETGIRSEHVRLTFIRESLHQQTELSLPPGSVSMPGEPIKTPLQLARLVVALTFVKQEKWGEAADQLDKLIASGPLSTLKPADVYAWAAYVHYHVFGSTWNLEALEKACGYWEDALLGYSRDKDETSCAMVQYNLAAASQRLAEERRRAGTEPHE